ncbi:hypothetical protein LZ32DRAFT_611628 [Colletotrichum eremochloae]|nr:hypothetical protein LZ32DRAFT_611628 [Colletotrichum eremochloae]
MPFELHCLIASYLDYTSILKMCSTNRHFRENLSPRTLMRPAHRFAELHKLDVHGWLRGRYVCYGCSRVLPPECFGDKMARPQRTRGTHRMLVRYCWDCAVKYKCYKHLQPAKKQGALFYLCWRCGKLWHQADAQRCQKVLIRIHINGVNTGQRGRTTLCHDPEPIL